jgi:hypothetical protein
VEGGVWKGEGVVDPVVLPVDGVAQVVVADWLAAVVVDVDHLRQVILLHCY